MNKNSPFKALKVYIAAGHLTWVIITPLLIFIGGGGWLVNRFGWDTWVMLLFVLAAIVVMCVNVWSYANQLLKMYSDNNDKKNAENAQSPKLNSKEDYDF
jgi:membrane protein implicated in regulation of membrane protease activity